MDASEVVAHDYLGHRGHESLIYEPDGNVAPDFLLDGRIAVEVRRLNQNTATVSGARGLEVDAIPQYHRVSNLLRSLGPSGADGSWFVYFKFKRPLEPWDKVKPILRQWLEAFRDGPKTTTTIRIGVNFSLDLSRASNAHACCFVSGGYSDYDSGGLLMSELQKNLQICIQEKTQKISHVRAKYPKWWLVLIDRIGYRLLHESEQTNVRECLRGTHDWDKVILVNPSDYTQAFEI
jgi:hypothetical protein